MKNYLNKNICKKCQGKCCKQFPGIAFPEDFKKPLLNSLKKAFKTKKWVVDWYESYPEGKGYFIRPAIKNAYRLYDPSWGGECIFLKENGCSIEKNKRPYGCRMLEPKEYGKCILHSGSKLEAANQWKKYEKIIEGATKIYENI